MRNKFISIAITACNEHAELNRLLSCLYHSIVVDDSYEIVLQLDGSKKTNEVVSVAEKYKKMFEQRKIDFILNEINFNGNFSEFKNHLNSSCNGEWIFNIDADEVPSELFEELQSVLHVNSNVDVFGVARHNTVNGITPDDIERWGWRIDEYNRINWPDLQLRIYKNDTRIKWEGAVHERIIGYNTISYLPYGGEFSFHLIHEKEIHRQREQNNLYDNLQRNK